MSNRNLLVFALTIATLVGRGTRVVAQTRDVDAILQEVERQQRATSVEYVGDITVTSRNGTARHKTWVSFRQGSGRTANRLIRFQSPAELRGVAFLSLGRNGGSPDQWIYLPSMKRERRLAPQDRDSSFAGTDFSYADLDEFDRSDYTASLEADQAVDGEACYTVRLVPRRPSAFAYETITVSQSRFVPRQISYIRRDRSAPAKVLSFLDYRQFDGHWVALRIEMVDGVRGSRTVVRLTDVKVDRPQPADRYTLQNLTREGADMTSAITNAPSDATVASNSIGWLQTPARPDGRAPVPWPGLSGVFDTRVSLYPEGRSGVDVPAIARARVDLKQQAGHGRLRVAAAVRAQAESGDQLGPVSWDPADRLPRQSPLSLRELTVSATLARALDLSVGRSVVAWGSTDTHSPASGFLPRDLTDPLAWEDLPLWGARLTGERGVVRFDLYHAFTTTPWRLPRLDGRYSPGAAEDVYLVTTTDAPPTRGFDMVRMTGRGPGWDVTGWFRTGMRPLPLLTVDLDDAPTTGDARIAPAHGRFASERAAGLEVNYPVGSWIVRGEAAVSASPDKNLGTAWLYTIQAEHAYRSGLLTFTYAGLRPDTGLDLSVPIDRAVLPSFTLAFAQSESWGDWRAAWVGTTDNVGGVFDGELARALTDGWRLIVGMDIPHGASTSALGAFSSARLVRTSLTFRW